MPPVIVPELGVNVKAVYEVVSAKYPLALNTSAVVVLLDAIELKCVFFAANGSYSHI